MNQYIPSKKFITITGSVIAIIGIALLVQKTVSAKKNKTPSQTASLTVSELVQKDSDKDGIPDWEESLWGTDPLKTDSNEDGISDFEEISKKKAVLNSNDTDTTTPADDFSRGIFASIMSLRESGNLDSNSIANLAKNIANEAKERTEIPDFAKEESISVVPLDEKSNRNYLEKIRDIILKYEKQGTGTEYALLAKTLENTDTQIEEVPELPDIDKLSSIGETYIALAKELSTTPAPSKYLTLQTSLINGAYKTGTGIKNIASSSPGSVEIIIGISQYKKYINDFDTSISSFATLLVQNDIMK